MNLYVLNLCVKDRPKAAGTAVVQALNKTSAALMLRAALIGVHEIDGPQTAEAQGNVYRWNTVDTVTLKRTEERIIVLNVASREVMSMISKKANNATTTPAVTPQVVTPPVVEPAPVPVQVPVPVVNTEQVTPATQPAPSFNLETEEL